MASTRIIIVSTGADYTLPGTSWTQQQIVSNFADSVPGIGSMTAEETWEGEDKVFTFRPRTGTKG